jgi:hypothetical protein
MLVERERLMSVMWGVRAATCGWTIVLVALVKNNFH